MKTCVFAGTFDPFTKGHKQIVDKALTVYERVVIVLGVNQQKTPLFSMEERMSFINKAFEKEPRVSVEFYGGYMMDYMREHGYTEYIRGIRGESDLAYENVMKENNKRLNGAVNTVFIECDKEAASISSSLIREKLFLGESVEELLPSDCVKEVESAFRKKPVQAEQK